MDYNTNMMSIAELNQLGNLLDKWHKFAEDWKDDFSRNHMVNHGNEMRRLVDVAIDVQFEVSKTEPIPLT